MSLNSQARRVARLGDVAAANLRRLNATVSHIRGVQAARPPVPLLTLGVPFAAGAAIAAGGSGRLGALMRRAAAVLENGRQLVVIGQRMRAALLVLNEKARRRHIRAGNTLRRREQVD